MGTANHWPDCWRNEAHPACRLAELHRLQVENLALRTQLQRERTGHLVETFPVVYAGKVSHHPIYLGAPPSVTGNPMEPPRAIPCHDHIDPPIVSGGPTWAHRSDDPPSLTP